MRPPPTQAQAPQTPAQPGFVVFGYPKVQGSSRSAPAAGTRQSLPFERVQMNTPIPLADRPFSSKRECIALFERVQLATAPAAATPATTTPAAIPAAIPAVIPVAVPAVNRVVVPALAGLVAGLVARPATGAAAAVTTRVAAAPPTALAPPGGAPFERVQLTRPAPPALIRPAFNPAHRPSFERVQTARHPARPLLIRRPTGGTPMPPPK